MKEYTLKLLEEKLEGLEIIENLSIIIYLSCINMIP